MLEDTQSCSPSESPKIFLPKPAGSGLTLVIPSLKSLKASQITTKKAKSLPSSSSQPTTVYQDVDTQEKKPPRPVKLKPLKEVLSKLIAQIKRKDDYAFFLTPVNTANVPGYTDLIKSPMDFGTMTHKVNRGKYRSLDEFTSDFKLVIKNAKIFNPLGSIYHAEADRIEVWGLDHISKAASTVIQYETDWTIDVEKDDDELPVNIDQDEDDTRGTPMDVDGSVHDERSVSVAPFQPAQMSTRRGPRGQYRREKNTSSNALSESLDADGGLPGSKDGIGAFPSGSGWAKTMLALKMKGKRYKTKKERMRIERDGPPLLPDGSLNYTEMEDPFSVLSLLVPDQLSRPQLLPLYPPLYQPPPQPSIDPSSTQTSTPQPQSFPSLPSTSRFTSFSSATSLPLDHTPPSLPFLNAPEPQGTNINSFNRRRHWVINRNIPTRQKGKEREDDPQELADTPSWQTPREPSAVDFGSFSILAGALAEEMARKGISSTSVSAVAEVKESLDQEVTLDLIKHSLVLEGRMKGSKAENEDNIKSGVPPDTDATNLLENEYWTDGQAAEAEEYIKDVVYGGVEGFAYVRSLAEFINDCSREEDPMNGNSYQGLHLPRWAIENIVDPLTEGRHSLLRETAIELSRQQNHKIPLLLGDPRQGTVASQVLASLHFFPTTLVSLSSLLHIRLQKIDMGSLLKAPHELFMGEGEWAGKGIAERRRQKLAKVKREDEESAAATLVGKTSEVEEPERSLASLDADLKRGNTNGNADYELWPPEEVNEVLECVADIIVELDKKTRAKMVEGHGVNGLIIASDQLAEGQKLDEVQKSKEDPSLLNLRLNLLALAKRAPLDTIAHLPKDLVPAHIRHFVPTLGSSA